MTNPYGAMRGPAWALLLVMLIGCGQYEFARSALSAPAAAPEQPAAAPPEEQPATRSGSGGGARHRVLAGRAAVPPPAPDPGAPLQPASASMPRMARDPQSLAVVIGIDRYPSGSRDLTAAVSDARLVHRALLRLGFSPRRTVLLVNGEATRRSILRAVSWLGRRTTSDSLGVLFYAGHVRKVVGDDGDSEEVDEALLGADGSPVLDGEIAAALAPARGRMWLGWAGCFAAGFSDAAAGRRVSSYASGEEALAYEHTGLGHSFMVEYMVDRALLGKGITTVEGMHRWASSHLRGRRERFRPLQDDRVAGRLALGTPRPRRTTPPPRDADDDEVCLPLLGCG